MRTTIDAAGRIVIPKKLRQQAGLEPGQPLEIRCRDGVIEVEPVSSAMRLEREGPFLVLVPESEEPMVTHEALTALIDQDRADRGAPRVPR